MTGIAAQVRRFATPDLAAQALTEAVTADLRAALARRRSAALVVSGGREPLRFFALLAGQALDWPRVVVTLADERWVGPQHPASNARLVRTHLLRGSAAAARFVPLHQAAPTPALGLPAATQALAQVPTPYAAVVLGMGEDGHTASLFPGMPGLRAALDLHGRATVTAGHAPVPPRARISHTLAALVCTARIHVLAAGAAKMRLLADILADPDTRRCPVAAVLTQRRAPVVIYTGAA